MWPMSNLSFFALVILLLAVSSSHIAAADTQDAVPYETWPTANVVAGTDYAASFKSFLLSPSLPPESEKHNGAPMPADFAVVAVTSSYCGGCRAFHPIFAQVAHNYSSSTSNNNVRFIWVECSSLDIGDEFTDNFCLIGSSDRTQVDSPSAQSSSSFPSPSSPPPLFPPITQYPLVSIFSLSGGAIRRLDAAGMKPVVNIVTGKPAADEPTAAAAAGGGGEEEDDDSSEAARWSAARFQHAVDHVVRRSVISDFSLSSNSSVVVPADRAGLDRVFDEFVSFTRASSSSAPAVAAAAAGGGKSNDTKVPQEPFVSILVYIPETAEAVFSQTGCGTSSFISPVEESNFAVSVDRDAKTTRKTCNQIPDEQLARNNASRSAFRAAAAFFALDAGQQRRFHRTDEASMASLMASAISGEHGFVLAASSHDDTASSFVAEHTSEHYFGDDSAQQQQPDPKVAIPCRFTSRAVVAVFRCAEIGVKEEQEQQQEQKENNGALQCLRFTADFRWMPHDRDEIIDLLVDVARPTVTVVTTADSDRVYPGDPTCGLTSVSNFVTSQHLPLTLTLSEPLSFEPHVHRAAHHRHFALRDVLTPHQRPKQQQQLQKHQHGRHGETRDDIHAHFQQRAAAAGAGATDGASKRNSDSNTDLRPELQFRRPPVVFAAFAETQSCKGRPDSFWQTLAALQKVAPDYQNTTFAIFDSLRYSELYLRAGMLKPAMSMGIAFAIFDGGKRFNTLQALASRNWTRDEELLSVVSGKAPSSPAADNKNDNNSSNDANAAAAKKRKRIHRVDLAVQTDVARLLLERFWSGQLRPSGKVNAIADSDYIVDGRKEQEIRLKMAAMVLRFFGAPEKKNNNNQVAAAAVDDGKKAKEKSDASQQQEGSFLQNSDSDSINEAALHPAPAAAPWWSCQGPSTRILLVEAPHKQFSYELKRTLLSQQLADLLRSGGADNNSDNEQKKTKKNAVVLALVNGDGRGALASENLWPHRLRAEMPFFVCARAQEEEDAAAGEGESGERKEMVSAPMFATFSRTSMDQLASLQSLDEKAGLVAKWLRQQCAL